MARLVQGVGKNDTGTHARENGKITKLYGLWSDMLKRCYSEKCHKTGTTYIGCTVSENFKSRAYFEAWCKLQKGVDLGWHLDKDLLFKGNKVYSETTCVFLPPEVNTALNKRSAVRGEYCIGVCFLKARGKFKAQIRKLGKNYHLGHFTTEQEAFLAYKIAKEEYLSDLADLYSSELDARAYHALKTYQVSFND